MRISILSLPSNPHCAKWAMALTRAGAKINVFSFEEGEIEGVNVHRFFPKVRTANRYFYLSYLLSVGELRAALHVNKTELVHPLHLTPFGSWAAATNYKPIISAAMGADVFEYPKQLASDDIRRNRAWNQTTTDFLSRLKANLSRNYYRNQVKKALYASAVVTADNQALVEALITEFDVPPEKIRLLRWGLYPQIFADAVIHIPSIQKELGLSSSLPVVLIPRGFKPIYQTDIAVQAVAKILSENPTFPAQFVFLAGGYEQDPQILNAVRALCSSTNRVIVVERALNSHEMAAIWQLTDCFVSTPIYDGFSAAVCEGMYVGALPILNDIPATRELFVHERNALFVTTVETHALAHSLKTAIHSLPVLKPKFAELNQDWVVKNAILSAAANEFLALCEQVLMQKKRCP